MASARGRNLTVIVADDDYMVCRGVIRAAESAGVKVVGIAADGEEALHLVKRLSPNAAILDIEMPRLDGLGAARRIRDEQPTPIVILTAHDSPELVAEAVELGVGAYLTKPAESGSLLRAVEIAVARHTDLMQLRRLNGELQRALEEVKTLRGILPICAHCKRIRDESGAWHQVEAYITRRSEAKFSHGMCPDCLRREFPDLADG
jgi:AmiR/NasT family two-component response regulator